LPPDNEDTRTRDAVRSIPAWRALSCVGVVGFRDQSMLV
jgi:hypothetical protein